MRRDCRRRLILSCQNHSFVSIQHKTHFRQLGHQTIEQFSAFQSRSCKNQDVIRKSQIDEMRHPIRQIKGKVTNFQSPFPHGNVTGVWALPDHPGTSKRPRIHEPHASKRRLLVTPDLFFFFFLAPFFLDWVSVSCFTGQLPGIGTVFILASLQMCKVQRQSPLASQGGWGGRRLESAGSGGSCARRSLRVGGSPSRL